MKPRARIVIDLGFGDGGKGLVVDHIAEWNFGEALVVRFSGGQQCGHTVIDPEGKKHIFSSYGSGTLAGCSTFCTEDTTMYLPALIKEYNILVELADRTPNLTYHPLAMVTTPYDVAYNRAKEEQAASKNGSCGMGVGATMKRSIETPHKLYVQDFLYLPLFMEKMDAINTYYAKLVRQNVNLYSAYHEHLRDILPVFMDALQKLGAGNPYFSVKQNVARLRPGGDVIFEGSQGVMLDMDHGAFPNVTYANTTSKNAFKYVDRWGLDPEMYYVTRCYTTRHGIGWMPNEKEIELVNNHEEINVHNRWQEDFRKGEMSYEMLNHAIRTDSCHHGIHKPKKCLVVTCLDQRPDLEVDFSRISGIDEFYTNDSPRRGNIRPIRS
jgi:adenylosuccinate synthase